MATKPDQQAAGSRSVLLTAVVALAVVAAMAFARVYQGSGIALRFGLLAAASVLLAGALERRHAVIAVVASAVGLCVAVGIMVFPDTTFFLLPTRATAAEAWQALSLVGRTAALQAAPTPPLPPLLLAGVTAVWAAAFAAHALAVRARSPLLALMPPAALVVFAGLLMGDGVRYLYILFFLAASFAVLFADALRRVVAWGPLTVWHGRRTTFGLASGTPARGASRVALACVAIAAIAPWSLPGFRSSPLLHLRSGATVPVSIDPIVDIQPRLLKNPAVTLFTVRSNRPAYWRFLSLDVFDGTKWKPTDPGATTGVPIAEGVLPGLPTTLPCPAPSPAGSQSPVSQASDPAGSLPQTGPASPTPGASPTPDANVLNCSGTTVYRIQQQFTFDHLAQPWLPAAYDPAQIALGSAVARYDPASASIVYPNGTSPGFRYSVTSLAVVPTPAQLRAVASMQGPASDYYTALPANLPSQIRSIALSWTRGSGTIYDEILDIQHHLRNGFTYTLRPPPVPKGQNPITFFLTGSHKGFCEQFAGTMAVMLRSLGIPARVAVGFTPGRYDASTGRYVVTTQDAHAWVEVLFPRYGWLDFNPTPVSENPVSLPYDNDTQPSNAITNCLHPDPKTGICNDGGRAPSQQQVIARKGLIQKLNSDTAYANRNLSIPASAPVHRSPWRGIVGWLLVAAVGAAALGIPIAKAARRRVAIASARAPRGRVLAAYRVLLERAGDAGLGRGDAETPQEYRDRLEASVAFGNGDLARLTDLTVRAAYGTGEVTERDAAEAVRAARRVAAEIRRAAGRLRAALGTYRMPPRGLRAGTA